MRTSAVLMALVFLCQCRMPPRESWQYIKTNGLVAYWSQPSPPFGASATQRYGGTPRQSYYYPRYAANPRYGQTLPSHYYSRQSSSSSAYRSLSPSRGYSSGYSSYLEPTPVTPQRRYDSAPSRPSVVESSPRITSRDVPARPQVERPSPPRVRIPVDEPPSPVASSPRPGPAPASSNAPAPSAPKTADSAPKPTVDLPFGTAVPGRVNMVNSPYAGKTQLVDVSGMGPGQTVKCPYTGKLFKVPVPQQAAANGADPMKEGKMEKPKLNSEPPAEDKKP